MNEKEPSIRRCAADGCEATRKTYPSGQSAQLCPVHESARVQASKRRLVVDPVTGETITSGMLAVRTIRRKQRAQEKP